MNQIVSIHQAIYIPLFDETLDKYIDKVLTSSLNSWLPRKKEWDDE